jgi:hypothetical protein
MVMQEVLLTLWQSFLDKLFPLSVSIVWLIIGLILGKVIGKIIKEILVRVKLDNFIIESERIKLKLSDMFSMLAKWIIYFIFIMEAAKTLQTEILITMIDRVVGFLIGVIQGSVIMIVGYSFAIYIKEKVISSKTLYGEIIGNLMFFLIIYLSISAALPAVGIETITQLTDKILLIIVGSIGLGIAIALGIGLKPLVEEMAKKYSKKFK